MCADVGRVTSAIVRTGTVGANGLALRADPLRRPPWTANSGKRATPSPENQGEQTGGFYAVHAGHFSGAASLQGVVPQAMSLLQQEKSFCPLTADVNGFAGDGAIPWSDSVADVRRRASVGWVVTWPSKKRAADAAAIDKPMPRALEHLAWRTGVAAILHLRMRLEAAP